MMEYKCFQPNLLAIARTLVSFILLLQSYSCSMDSLALSELNSVTDMLKELKSEVETLREARHQDKTFIKVLEQRVSWLERSTTSSLQPTPVVTPPHLKILQKSESHHRHHVRASRTYGTVRSLEKERRVLGRLESQLRQLQRDLASIVAVKEREVGVTEEAGDLRLEMELLRTEIRRLQQNLNSLRADTERNRATLAPLRVSEATNKWLQKTVEHLRSEIGELSSTLNVSASLNRWDTFESTVALLKSDFVALQKEVEGLQALHLKDAASVDQLQEEVKDLRSLSQRLSVTYQHLSEEVASLKDEVDIHAANRQFVSRISPHEEKNTNEVTSRRTSESLTADGASAKRDHHFNGYHKSGIFHRTHRHRHVKKELAMMQKTMEALEKKQGKIQRQIHWMKKNYTTMNSDLHALSRTTSTLENQIPSFKKQQFDMQRRMTENNGVSESLHQEILTTKEELKNITQTIGVVDKLHSSSLRIFEALETLEGRFDKSIHDLQKEVSKSDFNLGQLQSSFEIIREDQNDHYETLKTLNKDYSILKMEVQRDRYKVLTLQNEVLNQSLQECKTNNEEILKEMKLASFDQEIEKLQTQINDNQLKVDALYTQVKTKIDIDSLSAWNESHEELKQGLHNISSSVPQMEFNYFELKNEISKFVNLLPKDCSVKLVTMPTADRKSGVHLIHPEGVEYAVSTYCDMDTDGGGWTVIQRRQDGSEDFYRDWEDYKRGFGDQLGEYWLGNEVIHHMTTTDNYTLRMDMWDTFGHFKFAEYDTFVVANETDDYRLVIGGYHGNASDAMENHNGMGFSTKDRDNDASSTHCAVYYSSGWWYNHCQYVNINGRYNIGLTWYDIDQHEWVQLTKVEMKLRPSKMSYL